MYRPLRVAILSLQSIILFRDILKDEVLKKFYDLLNKMNMENYELNSIIQDYSEICSMLMKNGSGSLRYHTAGLLMNNENILSKAVQEKKVNTFIKEASVNDLRKLQNAVSKFPFVIKQVLKQSISLEDYEKEIIEDLPEIDNVNREGQSDTAFEIASSQDWGSCFNLICQHYEKFGTGIFMRYKACKWEDQRLFAIEEPDPVLFKDLIGYESERAIIVKNTENFLYGHPSNNLLLYGDRGTGKSTTVKALLNEYNSKGLRMVELATSDLMDFPKLLRELRKYRFKFVVFIDDLAFEDNEKSYTALKAVLEGGLESRPKNVVIYATSNRRHLIKEKFSDRAGLSSSNHDDEVRAADTLQEKLSLSDRFGITVTFTSPDKKNYLEIVDGLVEMRNIKIDREILHKEALKWELWYNGRSPRTAKQFVDWLEGQF